MTSRLFSFACAGVFLIALLLGGATRTEVLAPDLAGLAAIPLLGWAVWRLRTAPFGIFERWPMAILAGCFLVGLIQLIPLPPAVWTLLPGRPPIAADLAAAGLSPGWAPISLSPQATAAALLALIPAAALFLALRTLSQSGRRRLVLVLLLMAVASAVIGGLQVLGGPQSPLRFYAVTNPEPAVGFFANRNHLAALFVCAIPFAAAEALEAATRRPAGRVKLALMLALMALCAAGVAMTQSRAGILLLGLAMVGALALTWRSGLVKGAVLAGRAPIVLGALALLVVLSAVAAPLLFGQTFDRFDSGLTGDLRLNAAGVTARAIFDYAPFGSGLGSFVPVYMMAETPASMQNTYINHAHDDWLELLLEGGVLVLAVMLAFLYWLGRASWRAWRRDRPSGGGVARAASLAVGLLLVHSLVDYPLRGPAIMCVFALACGLMLPPREAAPAPGRD
jgi:O-antigen ligase